MEDEVLEDPMVVLKASINFADLDPETEFEECPQRYYDKYETRHEAEVAWRTSKAASSRSVTILTL